MRVRYSIGAYGVHSDREGEQFQMPHPPYPCLGSRSTGNAHGYSSQSLECSGIRSWARFYDKESYPRLPARTISKSRNPLRIYYGRYTHCPPYHFRAPTHNCGWPPGRQAVSPLPCHDIYYSPSRAVNGGSYT